MYFLSTVTYKCTVSSQMEMEKQAKHDRELAIKLSEEINGGNVQISPLTGDSSQRCKKSDFLLIMYIWKVFNGKKQFQIYICI